MYSCSVAGQSLFFHSSGRPSCAADPEIKASVHSSSADVQQSVKAARMKAIKTRTWRRLFFLSMLLHLLGIYSNRAYFNRLRHGRIVSECRSEKLRRPILYKIYEISFALSIGGGQFYKIFGRKTGSGESPPLWF